MIKKILLLIALVLLSCISAQRPPKTPEQNARDFVTGFFNTLNGNFTLDENCIGKETKDNINEIIENFHNKNYAKIIEDLKNIKQITLDTCPIAETRNYINQKISAIEEGYYFSNFQKNFMKIGEIVMNEVTNKHKSGTSVGVACASIEKLTIYRQQNNQLAFLALEEETIELPKFDIDLDGFKKFFKGILEGVSSVPFDKNFCYTTTVDIKIEEVKLVFEHLYNSIKARDGKKFYEAVLEVLALLKKLENTNEHCNISGLIKSIGTYATPYVGIAKLIYNVVSHYDLYWADLKAGYHAFANKEWESAGSSIGHFASTLLSWTTS